MSKNNQVITISPPMFIGEGNQKESISSKGHRCSYCHGNGFFWGEEQRERVKVDCPVCKGSGKLDAVITIGCRRDQKKGIRTICGSSVYCYW